MGRTPSMRAELARDMYDQQQERTALQIKREQDAATKGPLQEQKRLLSQLYDASYKQTKLALVSGPSKGFHPSAAPYAGNEDEATIRAAIRHAKGEFLAAAKNFDKSDESLLMEFLSCNLQTANLCKSSTFFEAWEYICSCLEPEHATPKPVAAPAARVVEPEPATPILERKQGERSDDYSRRQMVADAISELQPQFQESVKNIFVDNCYLTAVQRKQLFRRFASTRMPLTESTCRALALDLWGSRVGYLTTDEQAGLEMDGLNADAVAKQFGGGDPRQRMATPSMSRPR